MTVPAARVRSLNQRPARPDGEFVLYWMVGQRRTCSNFALDRAVELAQQLKKPLVILEALRIDYPWASQRLHQFIVEGMAANAQALNGKAVLYYPYLEPHVSAGKGLI